MPPRFVPYPRGTPINHARAFALIVLLGAASAAAEPIPARDFARLPEFDEAKLSPTAEFLAVALRRDGARILVVLKLATLDVASIVKFNAPNEVYRFYWANDERLLISLAVTPGAYDFPLATGELYAVNADGADGRIVFGRRAEDHNMPDRLGSTAEFHGSHRLTSLLGGDPRHVLITTYRDGGRHGALTEAARLDIYSGALHTVARAPLRDAFLLADRAGQIRFALGRNDAFEYEVHYRRDAAAPWQRVAVSDFGDGELLPVAFVGDTRNVYVLDNRHTDTRELFRLDPDTGALTNVFAAPGVDVDRVLTADADGVAYGARYLTDGVVYHVLDDGAPYAAVLRAAIERFPGAAIEALSFTRDGRRAIVKVVSDRDPGTFYLYDAGDARFDLLLRSRRWLDPTRLAGVSAVTIEARDGERLPGFLTAASDWRRPGPLIVMPHGGPHGLRDDASFDDVAQLFAQYGYAVLKVNYRGSPGYGRRYLRAGFAQWGGVIEHDIADATHWAIASGIADPNRIAIVGASFGAYAAVTNTLFEPGLYRCAIGVSGVYDLPMMLESGDLAAGSGLNYLRQTLGTDPAALAAISPVQNAARLTTPLLIVHGALDQRAPVAHARRLRDALTALGRPIDYAEEPREAHGFYDEDNRTALYERMLAFLARHLDQASN